MMIIIYIFLIISYNRLSPTLHIKLQLRNKINVTVFFFDLGKCYPCPQATFSFSMLHNIEKNKSGLGTKLGKYDTG